MLLEMDLIMLAEKLETSPSIFVFRMTFSVYRGSGQARVFSMYPRRLCLGSRAKAFTLQGRYRCFGDSIFHTSFRGVPLLAGDTAEVVSSSATSSANVLIFFSPVPLSGGSSQGLDEFRFFFE